MSPAGPVTQQPVAAPKQHSLTTTAEEPEVKKTNAKTNTYHRQVGFMRRLLRGARATNALMYFRAG